MLRLPLHALAIKRRSPSGHRSSPALQPPCVVVWCRSRVWGVPDLNAVEQRPGQALSTSPGRSTGRPFIGNDGGRARHRLIGITIHATSSTALPIARERAQRFSTAAARGRGHARRPSAPRSRPADRVRRHAFPADGDDAPGLLEGPTRSSSRALRLAARRDPHCAFIGFCTPVSHFRRQTACSPRPAAEDPIAQIAADERSLTHIPVCI